MPPDLHWGLLLLLHYVTQSLFGIVWIFIQANWARKLSGKTDVLVQCTLGVVCTVTALTAIIAGLFGGNSVLVVSGVVFGFLLAVSGAVCGILCVFSIRRAMVTHYNSVEKIGLTLSGVITFFFSIFYFQYHINRIARWKKTGTLS